MLARHRHGEYTIKNSLLIETSKKKNKNVFPILTQSFIQSLFPILTNPKPIVTQTIYQSLIEEKNALGKL